MPGEFCSEQKVGKHKFDVPIRRFGGDLLFVECKVTNSEVNSVKRLRTCAQEFGGFQRWADEAGEEVQTVPSSTSEKTPAITCARPCPPTRACGATTTRST